MSAPQNHRVATLRDPVGHDFGRSRPTGLDQPRIDAFAECTGDDQWIHVAVERARTRSPLGGTIADGLPRLALIPATQYELGVDPDDTDGRAPPPAARGRPRQRREGARLMPHPTAPR